MSNNELVEWLQHFINTSGIFSAIEYLIMSMLTTYVLFVSFNFFGYVCYHHQVNRLSKKYVNLYLSLYIIFILIPISLIIYKYFSIFKILTIFHAVPGIIAAISYWLCSFLQFNVFFWVSGTNLFENSYFKYTLMYYFGFLILCYLDIFNVYSYYFHFYSAFIIPFQTVQLIFTVYCFVNYITFSDFAPLWLPELYSYCKK